MGLPCDWQISKQKIAERGQYLLHTQQWTDCNFIVGQEPYQQTVKGHKLFLAMSSPVFEAMFFGRMAEKNDPIPIRDVQPEAFKALLEYIYTDHVDLGSFELACELCYCAKKYMLPFLVKECTKFLWSDLSPKKACRAYEFAKLFEEPVLTEKCLHIICTKTIEVLNEQSWEEIELGTLTMVLEQNELEVNSEIDLFTAVESWAKAECARRSLDPTNGKSLRSVVGDALSKIRFLTLSPQEFAEGPGMSTILTKDESFAILMNILCTGNKAPMPEGFSNIKQPREKPSRNPPSRKPIHDPMNMDKSDTFNRNKGLLSEVFFDSSKYNSNIVVLNPIRNITPIYSRSYPPFDSGPSTSEFQPCDLSLMMNGNGRCLLQDSQSSSTENNSRRESNHLGVHNSSCEGVIREGPKYYCLRTVVQQTECLNTNVLDSSVTFCVDKNICVMGVQVPTQIAGVSSSVNRGFPNHDTSYTEILYAHLLDSDGTRLTYTHFSTKVDIGTLVEITFNRPVYIQKNKVYRVGVAFNKAGWYPIGVCTTHITCDTVFFSFGVGNSSDCVRDGLIRSIVFMNH